MLHNQRGMAMPLVLTVMFVLSLFGVTVWQFAATDVLHVERDELKMQAHYLARSGGDAMADYLMRTADVQVAHSVITRTDEHSPATGSLGQDKTFRVNVIGSPMNSMTIISQGIRNGVTRTLAFDLTRLDAREIFNKGIFTKGDLDVSLMSPLSGTLASAGEVTAPPGYDETLLYPHEPWVWEYGEPKFPEDVIWADPHHGLNPYVTNQQPITIRGEYYYSTIDMESDAHLTFDTSDYAGSAMRVVVDRMYCKGDVTVVGGGQLHLYVRELLSLQTPILVNNDPSKLFIFLKDGAHLDMRADGELYAYIFGPNADIHIQSEHSTVVGSIVGNLVLRQQDIDRSQGGFIHIPLEEGGILDAVVVYRRGPWRD